MKRTEGLAMARTFRTALQAQGFSIERMLMYGSVARDTATEDSDLDIAVVCLPFRSSRHDENMELRRVRRAIDPRISPYCFHPDDFTSDSFPLAQEIERTGVEV